MSESVFSAEIRDELTFYDTASRRKVPFEAGEAQPVGMYVCGPTVYSRAHIGNLRTYIFSDVLRRTLVAAGYVVNSVMNLTDVGHLANDSDDGVEKLEQAARVERLSAWEIAGKYAQLFFRDTDRLNISPFSTIAKATDHIAEQIDLARRLDDRGLLYRTPDGMYFDTSKIPDYGKLTPNDDREHLRAGGRVPMSGKRAVTDFAVWKFSDPSGSTRRDMEWSSPWGSGFPGWHLECSAMAEKYLGATMDIHVGGVDHIAIHHTNEIAQSEAATGQMLSRFWMHSAFLVLAGERRMGKSEGNKVVLDELVQEGFHPFDFRYLVLQSHYRSPLDFSWDALAAARVAHRRLRDRYEELRSESGSHIDPEVVSRRSVEFARALGDDLNTPRSLALAWDLLGDTSVGAESKRASLDALDDVLGLRLREGIDRPSSTVPPEILDLAHKRQSYRRQRRFSEADAVRVEIESAGWVVEDSAAGFSVHAAEER